MNEPARGTAHGSDLSDRLDVDRPAITRVQGLAARLRCTEGQLYSMVIALTASSALVILGGVPLGTPPRATAAPGSPTHPPVVVPGPVSTPSSPPIGGLLPLHPAGTSVPPDLPSNQDVGGGAPPSGSTRSSPQPPVVFGDFRVPSPGAPRALTSDATHVYAGTDNGGSTPSRLVMVSRTGDPARMVTVSDQEPERTGGLSAAAMRGADVLVTDRSRAALLQIDPRTGQQQVLTKLPDLPPCFFGITGTCQPGVRDLPPTPEGLALAGPYVYISDAAQGTIWRYTFATRQLTAWYASSDFSTGSGPSGLALDLGGGACLHRRRDGRSRGTAQRRALPARGHHQ